MKPAVIALGASLALNVVLLANFSRRPPVPRDAAMLPATGPVQPSTLAPEPPPAPRAAGELPDIPRLRRELLAAGIPADKLPDLIRWVVSEYYEEKQRALGLRGRPGEYWRSVVLTAYSGTPEERALRTALEKEQKAVLKELLGPEYRLSDGQRELLQGLPPEKADKLAKIFADYRDMEEQLYTDNPDRGSPEVRARVDLLAKERRRDIENLLSPEELLVHDLRTSAAANQVRNRFGAFQPTEAEFRAVYDVYKAAGDRAVRPAGMIAGGLRQGPFDHEVRRILGETRFAELQEANDWQLHQTREFVASIGLPPAVTPTVLALQRDYQARLQAVQRDREISQNEKDARRIALGQEAREALRPVLGPEGLAKYEQRAGTWLRQATNPPRPFAPVP